MSAPQSTPGNFFEVAAYRPIPLQQQSPGNPAQMFGDVWVQLQPLPGYKPREGLVGEHNSKFMRHQFVLRGGSFATPHSLVRESYRTSFRRARRPPVPEISRR